MPYGKPAIEFQASLKTGDKFMPIESYAGYAGNVLVIESVRQAAIDPDEWLYNAHPADDPDGGSFVRCWWLRKCCRRIGPLPPS